jgi:hypothetical protein
MTRATRWIPVVENDPAIRKVLTLKARRFRDDEDLILHQIKSSGTT